MKIRINCDDRYGKIMATVPDGWRVVNGKVGEETIKGDKSFWADTKEFKTLSECDIGYLATSFFKVIRRIHRKKAV